MTVTGVSPKQGWGSWPGTIELCCGLDFGGDKRDEIGMLRHLVSELESEKPEIHVVRV